MIPRLSSRQPHRLPWTLERLVYERSLALGSALDVTTAAAYDSHLNSYLNFCHLHQRPIEPTADTLSFYIVWLSHHIEPRSVDSYLSGITSRLEPFFPTVREIRRLPLVARTLKGCKRRLSRPVSQKGPLGVHQITHVISVLRASHDFDDILFCAMLTTGFTTLQRLGELTWPDNPRSRSWRKVALRHSVTTDSSGSSYLLPTHKTDRHHAGARVLLPTPPILPFDGLITFRRYLQTRDALHPYHPALWVTRAGTVPTRSWFLRHLHHFVPSRTISGHSMRAGGATALACAGFAPALIQSAGRWSSTAFEGYIRQHPFILHAIMQPGGMRRGPHHR